MQAVATSKDERKIPVDTMILSLKYPNTATDPSM